MFYSIRPLSPDDAELYCTFREESLANEPAAFATSLEEQKGADLSAIQRLLAYPDGTVWGAFLNDSGALVGLLGFKREERLQVRHKAALWGFYVRPDVRQRGIGTALVKVALEQVRRDPTLERIRVIADEDNAAAHHLFEQLGFKTFGLEPGAAKVNGQDINKVFLGWYIGWNKGEDQT